MPRFKMIASSYLILIKKNQILLLFRENTGYEDGNWGLPAGHVEDDESITTALTRESEEEIGLIIYPKNAKLIHVMHRKEKDIRVDFFFIVKKYSGEPKNSEPEKCAELKWFELKNLPANTIPYIKQAIENVQKGIFYSERGF